MNNLCEISCENWPELRDLYKINWPRFISSYSLIDTFIDWKAKGCQDVSYKIFSCDEKWREHGTYFIDVSKLFLCFEMVKALSFAFRLQCTVSVKLLMNLEENLSNY